jgi:hypothetical protein
MARRLLTCLYRFRTSDHQRWVKYPNRGETGLRLTRVRAEKWRIANTLSVRFVDETEDLEALYNTNDKEPAVLRCVVDSPAGLPQGSHAPPPVREASAERYAFTQIRRQLPRNTSPLTEERALSCLPPGSQLGLHNDAGSYDGACFPLQSAQEARLMKYYLEYMCTWVCTGIAPRESRWLTRTV